MGFSSDIMHDFVAKEIRNIYSSYDGWKISYHPLGNGYDTLVLMERPREGHRELSESFCHVRQIGALPTPGRI